MSFESIRFVFLNHIFFTELLCIGLWRQFTRWCIKNVLKHNFSSPRWNLFQLPYQIKTDQFLKPNFSSSQTQIA